MMEREKKCLVGHDSEDFAWLAVVIFAVIVIVAIVCFLIYVSVQVIFYGGAALGGFFSLKNYLKSLKHNIWDSNFKQTSLEKAA